MIDIPGGIRSRSTIDVLVLVDLEDVFTVPALIFLVVDPLTRVLNDLLPLPNRHHSKKAQTRSGGRTFHLKKFFVDHTAKKNDNWIKRERECAQ